MLTANFKLGPFHISPLLLTATGMGTVPNERREEDPERLEMDGFVTARPELRAALPIGANHTVRADARLGSVWYRQFDRQNQTNYSVSGTYDYAGPRLQLSLADSYFRGGYSRFTPLDAEQPPDATLETDDWIPYTQQNASADVGFLMTERISLTVGGRRHAVRYGEVDGTTLPDREILALDTSFETPVTTFSSVGAVYEWQRAEDPDPNSFRNSSTQALGLRYVWRRPSSLLADVVAGYRRIDPDDEAVTGYRGWNFSASLSGQPIERLQAGLQVSRSTFLSSYGLNLYGVRQGGAATLAFAASRHARLTGSVGLFVHDYPADVGEGSETGAPREDVLASYSVGGSWSFARFHNVSFGIGKSERDSNVDDFDRVGLLLNFGYFFVY